MPISTIEPKYITKKELAKLLAVSPRTINRMEKDGKVPPSDKTFPNLNRYDFQQCKAMLGIYSTNASA
ncbi:helix-turn-helix transcriptional regulator [Sulfurospirillum cavolei]|uniref:helix-turn-helix transcriptional regulator n=1 Tax=Sulfurospirillum cavolei TaxID=366522 RepID=UPI003FA255A7